MAQDQPTETPGDATRLRPFPNMLPGAHGAFPPLSFLPPHAQGLPLQHPLSNYASFLESSFPSLDQYAGFSIANAAPSRLLKMAPFTTPERQAALYIRHTPASKKSTQAAMVLTEPPAPVRPGQKRSRLPSDDVGRKVPRKSTSSSPQQSSALIPSKARPGQKPARPIQNIDFRTSRDKQQGGPPTRNSAPAQRLALASRNSQANVRPPHATNPTRTRPIVADDEDYDEKDAGEKLPLPSSDAASSSKRHATSKLTGFVVPTGNTARTTVRPNRPRPKYDYSVPPALEGTYRAFGEDNWMEYIILCEKRCLKDITEAEFAGGTKQIFSAYDETTQRRLEKMVINKVVLPVLQAHNQTDQQP